MKIKLSAKKGLTLVEVVVSLAIMSILAVFIVSVYASSVNIVAGNANMKKNNTDAAAGIENEIAGFDPDGELSITNQQDGSFEIDFGGMTVNPDGSFIIGSDKNNESKFYFFIAD